MEEAGGLAVGDYSTTAKSASYYIGGSKVTRIGCASGTNYATAYDGRTIGGGLLIIYANNINVGDNAKFESYGKTVNGSCYAYKSGAYYSGGAGGGSGGGSINIFYEGTINGMSSDKFTVITGSYSPKGTFNVGSIENGTYETLLSTQ